MILQFCGQFEPQYSTLVLFYTTTFFTSHLPARLKLATIWVQDAFSCWIAFWFFIFSSRPVKVTLNYNMSPQLLAPPVLSLILLIKLTRDFHPSLLSCTSQGWSSLLMKEEPVYKSTTLLLYKIHYAVVQQRNTFSHYRTGNRICNKWQHFHWHTHTDFEHDFCWYCNVT